MFGNVDQLDREIIEIRIVVIAQDTGCVYHEDCVLIDIISVIRRDWRVVDRSHGEQHGSSIGVRVAVIGAVGEAVATVIGCIGCIGE